ncbi:hypothetical protein [Breznakia pachnodae]|uniref:Guanylate cyclase domain-containing protein n=1 Tax=Breznakia pachnodae TaxID=265178 RepID=A0ABU0DXT1_9FIRM|nr:hypothetical protein [Breznakia pachnodae]MDQ0359440.1 hypothetical protein [Breznakia pachnodae]
MNYRKKEDYKKYIVAFIDILGFSSLVKKSINDANNLLKIDTALEKFNNLRLKKTWEDNQILIDVEEDAQKKNLDDYYINKMARCFCFSDSIIITVNGDNHINERTSALIAVLSKIGAELLSNGILIRGAISWGDMHVDDNSQSSKAFGPAIIDAYRIEEDQAIFPRIVLSGEIVKRLNYPLDTKKNRHPYHQYIERYNDGLVGFNQLTYFRVMHNVSDKDIGSNYYELLSKAKKEIIDGLDENITNIRVFEKYLWLKNEFNNLCILMKDISNSYFSESIKDMNYSSRNKIFYSSFND